MCAPHSIHWGHEQNKKDKEGRTLSLCLTTWAGTRVFSCPHAGTDTISPPCSQALGLGLKLITLVPLVFRPLDLDWNYTPSFPGSPACRQWIVRLLRLHNQVSQIYIYAYTYVLLVLFLWRAPNDRLVFQKCNHMTLGRSFSLSFIDNESCIKCSWVARDLSEVVLQGNERKTGHVLNGPSPAYRDKMARHRAENFSFHPDFWHGLWVCDFQLCLLISLIKPFDLILLGNIITPLYKSTIYSRLTSKAFPFPHSLKGIHG